MSWVTNLILSTSILDEDKSTELNASLRRHLGDPCRSFGHRLVKATRDTGGDKYLETAIYLAAFSNRNGWTLEKFLDAVRSVRWDDPDKLQLFVKDEEDDRFTEVEIFPPQTDTLGIFNRSN